MLSLTLWTIILPEITGEMMMDLLTSCTCNAESAKVLVTRFDAELFVVVAGTDRGKRLTIHESREVRVRSDEFVKVAEDGVGGDRDGSEM